MNILPSVKKKNFKSGIVPVALLNQMEVSGNIKSSSTNWLSATQFRIQVKRERRKRRTPTRRWFRMRRNVPLWILNSAWTWEGTLCLLWTCQTQWSYASNVKLYSKAHADLFGRSSNWSGQKNSVTVVRIYQLTEQWRSGRQTKNLDWEIVFVLSLSQYWYKVNNLRRL